mgnify:CR=1 FL=1
MSDTEYKSSHKLSWFGGTILIFIAVVADVIDWFEVGLPITDVVMGGVDVILLLKGLSSTQILVVIGLEFVLELIPGLDYLPFYTLGSLVIIAIDRSEKASQIAAIVPVQKIKKQAGKALKKTAQGTGVAAKRAQRTRRSLARIQNTERQVANLQKKLPGPLKSVPKAWGYVPSKSKKKGEQSPGRLSKTWNTARTLVSSPSQQKEVNNENNDYLDTFGAIERENFPEGVRIDTPPKPGE